MQLKLRNGNRVYYYSFAQMGLSVHLTENNEEILIGAPGIYTWKGMLKFWKTFFNLFIIFIVDILRPGIKSYILITRGIALRPKELMVIVGCS